VHVRHTHAHTSIPLLVHTGAFQCMVEGGDVAFVKHTTFANWKQEQGSSESEVSNQGPKIKCF